MPRELLERQLFYLILKMCCIIYVIGWIIAFINHQHAQHMQKLHSELTFLCQMSSFSGERNIMFPLNVLNKLTCHGCSEFNYTVQMAESI